MQSANDPVMPELSPTEELNRVIAEHLPEQDQLEFELGDTLDIKMSIVLVVIIFLADLSRKFLEAPMPLHWQNIQRIAVAALTIAGVLAIWELIPREYKTRMGHEKFLGWIEQLKAFYSHEGVANPEAKIVEFIRTKDAQRTQERIAANRAINRRKSVAMEWSFYSVMLALALNLATLLAVSVGRRF